MNKVISNYKQILEKIAFSEKKNGVKTTLIAVSKTFPVHCIEPLIIEGHKILEKIKYRRHHTNGLASKRSIQTFNFI